MADDEERREGSKRSGRRDPARNTRRDPPVIDGRAEDVTPVSDPTSSTEAQPEMTGHSAPVNPESVDAASSIPSPETTIVPPGDEPVVQDRVAEPRSEIPAFQRTVDDTARPGSRFPWGPLAALGCAALAAGLFYLFHQLSSLPPDNTAAVADLTTRLAALEARPSTDAAGLNDRLTAAERGLGERRNAVEALGKRVDGVAAALAAATALAAQPNVSGQIKDLQNTVAGFKTDLAGVQSSIAALPRPDIGRIDTRIGDLDQRIARLQGVVSGIPHVDLGPLTGKVDAIESRLKPIEAETDAARSPEQVAQRRAAPVAVTAQAIVGAIEAGQAFPKELEALRALGADAAKLAPLQAVAENGAPSLRDLQASLAELRDRVVAQGAAPASGSYMDRLVSGASSLVQVRPLGSVVGDSPAAITARMNEAIGQDDLGAALVEWRKLPESSQTASKALADRIRLRLDAEQAAKDIAANAIGAMASPRG